MKIFLITAMSDELRAMNKKLRSFYFELYAPYSISLDPLTLRPYDP
jgi:hypothetical protein